MPTMRETMTAQLTAGFTPVVVEDDALHYLYSYCLQVGKSMTSVRERTASYVLVPNESLGYQCDRLDSGLVAYEVEQDSGIKSWLVERVVDTMFDAVQVTP